MKNENYFIIQGWMINELELEGVELSIYAIIYGFTQDGENEFTGSIKYMCSATRKSRPTIIKSLKNLITKSYITKVQYVVNNVTFNKYTTNLQVVKKLYGGGKETLLGGGKETLPNNNTLNNTKNIKKEFKRKRKTKTKENKLPQFYNDYPFFKKEFKSVWFEEFLPIKRKKKASLTEKALVRQLNKIQKWSKGKYSTALSILEKSADGGWSDVYAPKDKKYKTHNNSGSRNFNTEKHEYDEADIIIN